jgi:hypothetical protein
MIVSPEFLRDRLSGGGVTQAAVVDEAFDPEKAVSRVTSDDEFWAELDAQPEWRTELESKAIPCADQDSFRIDGLRRLWERRKDFTGEIAAAVSKLFVDAEQNLADPHAVSQHLGQLGLTVKTIGTKPAGATGQTQHALPSIPGDVQLVFLDYDLEGDSAFDRSKTRMSELVAQNLAERKEKTPFLVLFSNKPNARQLAEGFRKRTGYLRGAFAFIPKQEARDFDKLRSHLADTCVGMTGLGHLQYFFFALKRRLAEVAKEVESEVMQLNVQDQAFIQRLALQEEGACIGEYMLDFFGAVLSHELRSGKEVQEARHKLDAFAFEDRHFPFSDLPSAPIQRLYRAVLTEPGVGPASPHPRATDGKGKYTKGNQTYKAPPLLMLGDIFAKNARSPVYVVMNPACDLQYSPGRRDPRFEVSVLLMHGTLESLKKPRSNSSGLRMEWLQFGRGTWRVAWEHQRLQTMPLQDFEKWRKKNGYDRIARLSLPYSLKLQQMWLAELGRIGLPVSLPFYDAFDIQLYSPNAAAEWVPQGELIKRGAIVSRHPRDTKELSHFTLTPAGRDQLYEQLKASVNGLAAFQARQTAANALLAQAKIWNEGLTETPHKLTNDYHEDIPGLLFAWRTRPSLKGLGVLTEAQRNKLAEPEKKSVAKQEKVALIAVIGPLTKSAQNAAAA